MKTNKSIKWVLSSLLLLAPISIGLASCDSSSKDTSEVEVIQDIKVNKKSLSLKVGDKEQLTISVTPSSASLSNLSFEYDEKIIFLNKETFEVTGLKEGSTTLKISAGNISKEVAITVTGEGGKVSLLTCSVSKKTLSVGDSFQLEVGYLPETASAPKLLYLSDATSVATISKTGLIKAVSRGTANILVSVQGDSSVPNVSVVITVTEDSGEVNRDNLLQKIEEASSNEASDINAGSLSITTKMYNRDESSFTNDYTIYNDRIYNNIKSYDGSSYTLAYIKGDDNYLYTDVINSDGTSNKSKNLIEENSAFSSSYSPEKANKLIGNVAFYSENISQSYTYGIGSYIEDEIINNIFMGYESSKYTAVTPIENGVTLSLKRATYVVKEIYNMEITFSERNFSKITYDYKCYNEADISEDYVPNEGASTKEDYRLEATFTKGERGVEANQRVNYKDFYFSDFDVNFSSKTTENALSFYRGETITYALKSFLPAEASETIDRIEVASSSNEDVISVSNNKLAVIAVSEGEAVVTLKSKNVEKTYKLTVKLQPATSLKLSDEFKDTISSDETLRFKYTLEPWGAIDDITVVLTEESKQYATLTKLGDYYTLAPIGGFDVDSAQVTLQFRSESNPKLNMDKIVTISKKLTPAEVKEILVSNQFVSEKNPDYDNAKVVVTFDNDSNCIAKVYNGKGSSLDTFNAKYVMNADSSISLMNNSKSQDEYLSNLVINLDRNDISSINVKFTSEEDDDEYGGQTYEFRCYKESK